MRRNSIAFGDSVTVVYDPLESSMGFSFRHGESQEEEEDYDRRGSWYSAEDYQEMRQSMCCSCVEDGGTRGLEIYGKTDDCEANRLRRKNIVRSVLALQDEHKQNNVRDAKGLKMMASALSKEAIKEAQNRALQDSNEAYLLHSSDDSSQCYMKAKNADEYARKTTTYLKRWNTPPQNPAAASTKCHCTPHEKKLGLGENRRSSVGF